MIVVAVLAGCIAFGQFSFTRAHRYADDFLKQLGISKADADRKISGSILGGYLDQYGASNAKHIALSNRAAVATDLLVYTKKYVGSEAFRKEYLATREQEKPALNSIQSPEDMQQGLIQQYRKSVADIEASVRSADASIKPMFEKMLVDARKQLKDAEDPNNKMIATYRKNYPQALADIETGNKRMLAEWEKKYPLDHRLFVKMRLQQFLDETDDIDFNAELVQRNGKKYFANKAYESKGNRWKMAFRAGKEVVETSRAFVQRWIEEISAGKP